MVKKTLWTNLNLEAFDLFKNLLLNIKENLILFLTNIKLTNYNEIAKNL